MPMALFGYFGFECSANISETIINRQKNAPRAIVIGFIATAVLYTLFHFGLLNAMNAHNLARYNAPDFAAFINIPYLKQPLRFLIPTVSIIAIYGTAVALMNTNAFLLYAMANEKILKPRTLTYLNHNERPWLIILAQECLILLITSTITNSTALNSLCNLSVFLSFFLVVLSLLKIQHGKRAYTKIFLSIISLIIITGLII
jgi:amino acid transporter